jgi:hypothetical protein
MGSDANKAIIGQRLGRQKKVEASLQKGEGSTPRLAQWQIAGIRPKALFDSFEQQRPLERCSLFLAGSHGANERVVAIVCAFLRGV